MHHRYLPIINLSPLTFSAASRKILKMKRLFNPRKKSECEPQGQEPGSTLDRIVKDKEGVKKRLEEEEKLMGPLTSLASLGMHKSPSTSSNGSRVAVPEEVMIPIVGF